MDTNQCIKEKTEDFILSLSSEGVRTKNDVNNGWCIAFAEEVEYALTSKGYTHAEMLSNDYLVCLEEQPDSCYILHFGIEEMKKYDISANQYETYYRKVLAFNPEGLIGYHAWLYDRKTKKHYDIEHPEGVENVFNLSYFVSHTNDYTIPIRTQSDEQNTF